jgi:hypothetical protein
LLGVLTGWKKSNVKKPALPGLPFKQKTASWPIGIGVSFRTEPEYMRADNNKGARFQNRIAGDVSQFIE